VDGLLIVGEGAERAEGTALLEAGRGSPLTRAAHRGERVDPQALVARAREAGGILTVAAGLLDPLTPRFSVRDLAHEIGLPLVLCVTAGDGLCGHVRLALEAARGSGLAVAAVALTGWPDPPDRVLLDERRVLEETAGVPVVAHPGAPWPTGEWTAGARPAGAAVVLEPYTAWEPDGAVADPREAGRPALMAALLEIVGAEGPVLASRAYGLYNKASGGKKLTSIARAPLSGATYWLIKERRLVMVSEEDAPWQGEAVLRLPDTPAVRVRELGPRTLDEVPLDEIAELMRRLGTEDEAALKRAVLDTYGLMRLTARADESLGVAAGLR
jgi:hypothetical protein